MPDKRHTMDINCERMAQALCAIVLMQFVRVQAGYYPKCLKETGATSDDISTNKCLFNCPAAIKSVCGTDNESYLNGCYLCRTACFNHEPGLNKACDGKCPCRKTEQYDTPTEQPTAITPGKKAEKHTDTSTKQQPEEEPLEKEKTEKEVKGQKDTPKKQKSESEITQGGRQSKGPKDKKKKKKKSKSVKKDEQDDSRTDL